MRWVLLIGLFLNLILSISVAGTPEDVAKVQFQLMKEGKYAEAGALFDSSSLIEFKEILMTVFTAVPDSVTDLIFERTFGPSVTRKTAEAMSGPEFFDMLMKLVMSFVERIGPVTIVSDDILGRVAEGDTLCHLVVRSKMKVGESEIEELEIASYKQVEGEWRAVLSAKMKSYVQKLAQQMQRGVFGGSR